MAQITIDIPAGQTNRVMDAICIRQGYNPVTDGTKAAFCKAWVIKMTMQEVRAYERDIAAKSAYSTADDAAVAEIIIT